VTSRESLEIIFSFLKKEPVVCATGYLCRAAQSVKDRPENFYMIGSMGMASSIGLGAALAKPKKKIVILDGDGAVLMNLGHLPMAGAFAPQNLIHVVIDNKSYESTGGQPSMTDTIRLEEIAKASRYRRTKRVKTARDLKRVFPGMLAQAGPSFILVEVTRDSSPAAPRVIRTPEEITASFSESLK
jgi:thiamine pyrophosphate-dependent acetolactate synthase large subunit-like protein